MTYELYFHPAALKEWGKLDVELREQFKKVLRRRLQSPRVVSATLNGRLKNCYKIKLRQSGYRLVYQVDDDAKHLTVMAVGKRDKHYIYKYAESRRELAQCL